MSIVLVGTNPGLMLYSDGEPVAAASVWTVDWSVWGFGSVLITADARGWRTVGTDEHLARILLERFNRHFPEVRAFSELPVLQHTTAEIELDCDLRTGLRAVGGGIELQLSDVKDRRQFTEPAFALGEIVLGLSNVYVPCGYGELVIDGEPVAGVAQCDQHGGRWSSSAYLAVAEVWNDPRNELRVSEVAPGSRFAPAQRRSARHLHAING